MPKSTQTKNTNKRVKVQDVAKPHSDITTKDMKKVQGGAGGPSDQVSLNYVKIK